MRRLFALFLSIVVCWALRAAFFSGVHGGGVLSSWVTAQTPRRPAPPPRPSVLTGRVVYVLDGDTISVLDAYRIQHRIRFAGIDAPEKAQAFGLQAKTYLATLIANREVQVEVQDVDHYGREVGRVLQGGRDINLAMVAAGCAWVYRAYIREPNSSPYLAAEELAQGQHRGLWAQRDPMSPWDFRHSHLDAQ